MVQTTINNSDLGSAVRSALNSMYTELYRGGTQATAALTDATTISTDANNGPIFSVTLAGNRTLANPTNLVSGRTYIWLIAQDATGGRTLTYGTAFDWGDAGAPTLSTAAGKVDVITALYDGSKLLATATKGFH